MSIMIMWKVMVYCSVFVFHAETLHFLAPLLGAIQPVAFCLCNWLMSRMCVYPCFKREDDSFYGFNITDPHMKLPDF